LNGSFQAVQAIGELATARNHHPLVSLGPASDHADHAAACFDHGCVVTFTLRTLATGEITDADLWLARTIDAELVHCNV